VPDYTYDYFIKVVTSRKLTAKKKVEKNLASLFAQVKAAQPKAADASTPQAVAFEEMKKNVEKPARTFKMPYQISCIALQAGEEERQSLAVGLIDGAIVVLDLALGIEKHFIEKHPCAISALAFYEDKVLVSGSIDGKVNLCDLESENT